MEIKRVEIGKKDFLSLLLLADEQENMIDKYLERGDLYALYDDGLKCVCVVTDEGHGVFEIQNLATEPGFQRRGYASRMIDRVCEIYKGEGRVMLVGTGDVPSMVSFYQNRGFILSHRLENYITDHYDEPIYEDGVLLKDKVYFKMKIG